MNFHHFFSSIHRIGFAFIFGTLLVSESDDIPKYFGLLSTISTITFLGGTFMVELSYWCAIMHAKVLLAHNT